MKGGYPDVLVIASGFFSTAAFLPLLRYDSECRTVHDINGIAVMLHVMLHLHIIRNVSVLAGCCIVLKADVFSVLLLTYRVFFPPFLCVIPGVSMTIQRGF